jgi:hypothetical protein
MSTASHLEMHREHTTWRKEDDLWRDELAIWEREISETIKELPRLELSLRAHLEKLQQYGASIRLHEQDFVDHEHALAKYQRGETPEEFVQAQEHGRESERHEMQRSAHEMIKRQQHVVLTKWKLLFSALVAENRPKAAPLLSDH